MRPETRDNLERLIVVVETALDRLRPAPDAIDYEGWRRWDAGISHLIAELERDEGAVYRTGDPQHLRMAGVATSCTISREGVLRNWCAAARRRIQQAAA